MRLFTTGQILKLAGLSSTTFDTWCREGIVKAYGEGNGTGTR